MEADGLLHSFLFLQKHVWTVRKQRKWTDESELQSCFENKLFEVLILKADTILKLYIHQGLDAET